MNKTQILKAYNGGLLDEVKTQLVRYGTIENVKDWEAANGSHRKYTIMHHSMQWNVQMHNGEIKSVGFVL